MAGETAAGKTPPAVSGLIAELDAALDARSVQGLRRQRRIVESPQGARVRVDGRDVLHFGSNDYLGLAGDPRIVAAAREGASQYDVGAGASHLISGHFAPHEAIERELGSWIASCADARALLFSTGYLANLGIVNALVGRGDAVACERASAGLAGDRTRCLAHAVPVASGAGRRRARCFRRCEPDLSFDDVQ